MRYPGSLVETITTTRTLTSTTERQDMATQYDILKTWLKAHARTERGASMVEYALLVVMIALVAIGALRLLGGSLSEKYSDIDSGIDN